MITSKNNKYQERIIANTEMFRDNMVKNQFKISGDNHPICPVIIGDAKVAAQFAENLLSKHTNCIVNIQNLILHQCIYLFFF